MRKQFSRFNRKLKICNRNAECCKYENEQVFMSKQVYEKLKNT